MNEFLNPFIFYFLLDDSIFKEILNDMKIKNIGDQINQKASKESLIMKGNLICKLCHYNIS